MIFGDLNTGIPRFGLLVISDSFPFLIVVLFFLAVFNLCKLLVNIFSADDAAAASLEVIEGDMPARCLSKPVSFFFQID
ncbi:unnamed protein product [Cylicostephanus goldi]|uniref:Uncharacterized protein n=1 Tax=Cylicostephanus goldi TaxID=71465 RepID=A0A3P7MQW5_CYLGO|nr:unnamed protein product [Cylicostephanus goldi]